MAQIQSPQSYVLYGRSTAPAEHLSGKKLNILNFWFINNIDSMETTIRFHPFAHP